ncbi:hypothetical protein [Streptomyces resistomycificus]|uniref:hypothetical protein n=1 Tax=Streptomyces resistomycificus TaxID=67356 RepID=UPI0004AA24F5|nr:hypothetical protein [Streptomyces resistomycificus]KUN97670.1 hypothetical protein AQJ84_16255 [Streptomyces resistomycificus]
MHDQRTAGDGLRLAVRVLLHTVFGGAALLAVVTVASVLGPTLALDLFTEIEVRGDDPPPVGTWVTVTGTWHPEGKLGTDAAWPAVLDVASVRRVRQPADPYEQR